MAQGIILAGGFSSRTQSNKMHLSICGKPLIVHTIEAMEPFVNKIFVVTGRYDEDIRSFIKEDEKIKIIYNKDYEKGMFSSVLCGVNFVEDDFFIIPGDIPFVKKETYQKILQGSKDVRYPTYEGKEGHPLFLKYGLKEKLLKEDINSNLRLFRDKQDRETIEVDDKFILRDIDTLEDFERVKKERKNA